MKYAAFVALLIGFLGVLMLPVCRVFAEDWPEWRGPRRDGVARESGWLEHWPQGKNPVVAWRAQVGKGHSAVSISRGRALTMGWDGRQDTVTCFDAETGKLLWKHSYPCDTIKQWPGPRSTPTVSGERVYTLSQHGLLHALDFASGKVIWKVQLPASYNPDVDYGFAWSPLVEGDHLILGGGERGVALRIQDGQYAWGNDGKAGACASPVRFESDGTRSVLVVVNDRRENIHLLGIDPANGKELWRSEPWPEKWGAACIDPIVSGRSIFLTTAEQHNECARFTIKGNRLERDWSNGKLACYTGSCVLAAGHVFGVTKAGILKSLDWETGQEKWAQRGFGGHGALIAVDDTLLVQTSQQGDLVVVRANATKYEELRRFKVFEGQPETFTAPVVSSGRVYCRSYAGEVVCLATGRAQRGEPLLPIDPLE